MMTQSFEVDLVDLASFTFDGWVYNQLLVVLWVSGPKMDWRGDVKPAGKKRYLMNQEDPSILCTNTTRRMLTSDGAAARWAG